MAFTDLKLWMADQVRRRAQPVRGVNEARISGVTSG